MTGLPSTASRFLLTCALLTIYPNNVSAQCPSWKQLRADESAIDLTISDPSMAGLRMWLIYISSASLGQCTLGATFETLTPELTTGENRHVFWIGAEGSALHLFRLNRLYMIQSDRRYDVVDSVELDLPTTVLQGVPGLTAEAVVAFEGIVDLNEPVTIFYEGIMGTVPVEYWFPKTTGGLGSLHFNWFNPDQDEWARPPLPVIDSKNRCLDDLDFLTLDKGKE